MHNYQNAKSSASYLLRNVRLGDTETSILHNVQMNWDFLCHETRILFSLKNSFYETVVSFSVENLWGFVNKHPMVHLLLKKFLLQHNSQVCNCARPVSP